MHNVPNPFTVNYVWSGYFDDQNHSIWELLKFNPVTEIVSVTHLPFRLFIFRRCRGCSCAERIGRRSGSSAYREDDQWYIDNISVIAKQKLQNDECNDGQSNLERLERIWVLRARSTRQGERITALTPLAECGRTIMQSQDRWRVMISIRWRCASDITYNLKLPVLSWVEGHTWPLGADETERENKICRMLGINRQQLLSGSRWIELLPAFILLSFAVGRYEASAPFGMHGFESFTSYLNSNWSAIRSMGTIPETWVSTQCDIPYINATSAKGYCATWVVDRRRRVSPREWHFSWDVPFFEYFTTLQDPDADDLRHKFSCIALFAALMEHSFYIINQELTLWPIGRHGADGYYAITPDGQARVYGWFCKGERS